MTTRLEGLDPLDPAVTERIGELLRAHGLRRMPSRIQVLAVLEPVPGHLSVAEIQHRLPECLPERSQPPDLATIYRTVTTLVEQGVLHGLTLDGGVTTYGMATTPHHHAVCTKCNAVIEVQAPELSSALRVAMAASRFALSEQAGLTLRGLCPNCQDIVRDHLEGESDLTDPRPRGRRASRSRRG